MPQRFKRDYQDDPKDYLDKVIEHWIYKIPVLIDIAVAESEKDLRLTVAKRVTQVNFVQIFKLFVKSKIRQNFVTFWTRGRKAVESPLTDRLGGKDAWCRTHFS